MRKTDNCITLPVPIEKAKNLEEVRSYKEKISSKTKEQILEEKKRGSKEEPVLPIVSFQDCLEAFTEPEEIYGFYSPAIKKTTVAIKTTRIGTFPKYLVFKPHLFAKGDSWIPVKLEVEIEVPEDININWLRGTGKKDNEELLPDPNDESIDPQLIESIVNMGFGKIPAENALHATKGDVPAAIEWIMSHFGDPKINIPRKKESKGPTISPNNVQDLMSMGFTEDRATYALQKTDNNVERAIEWLFSHQDEQIPSNLSEEGSSKSKIDDGNGEYKLVAFINHIGSSTHSGHYICHIKKEGKWVKYNDEKVEESRNPPIQFGYLYFFERKD